MLLGDAILATGIAAARVTITCRSRYRRGGRRNQRLPHNDQTRITAASFSLIMNHLVRMGRSELNVCAGKRNKKRQQPRRVCYVSVCVREWRRVRPAANGGEYVGRSAAAHWAISGDLRTGRGGLCRSLFHHNHRCTQRPGDSVETERAGRPCRARQGADASARSGRS